MEKPLTLGYSPYGNGDSIKPFDRVFDKKQNVYKDGFKGVDAFILWGGTDIHSSLYKQQAHPYNGSGQDKVPSERDVFEWKSLLYCRHNHIPVIGICRGAQMLCAFAGGKLIQHVTGHSGHHPLYLENLTISTNSVHHQMMYPYDVPHHLLGWAEGLSSVYEGDESDDPHLRELMKDKKEPEIVWFPGIQGLAIQGHPEYMNAPILFVETCLSLVKEYVLRD